MYLYAATKYLQVFLHFPYQTNKTNKILKQPQKLCSSGEYEISAIGIRFFEVVFLMLVCCLSKNLSLYDVTVRSTH